MRIYSNKKRPVKASKDYADFTGKDFKTAKAQLEKDGYKEHEYGDTKEGNGYAVYRKGDKEVELTYKWVGTKNNAHAGKVLDVYVDEDINGACGKKSVKASTSGNIPYDLVSMLVALRDYISIDDTDYINDEHRMLVDVADSLYNAGITVAEMSPEYQAVYNKYGKDFFDLVLEDVAALDSQLTSNNVNDLIADYNDREATFTGVSASTKRRRSAKAVKASYDDRQILWVLDGDDNTWKCWGFAPNRFTLDIDHPDHQDPDELLEDLNYRNDANYTDYIVTYNGENPDDYGRTEPIKDKFVKASQTSVTSRKVVKASELTNINGYAVQIHDMHDAMYDLLLFGNREDAEWASEQLEIISNRADNGELDDYEYRDMISDVFNMSDDYIEEINFRTEIDRNNVWTALDDSKWQIVNPVSVSLWL